MEAYMTEDFTLESFISWCDDMYITNEASLKEIGKNIWDTIIRIFRKIAAWFKNLLLNINYFKNAVLSDQMNKDMVKVLQISQARTEHYFEMVMKAYKLCSTTTNKPNENTEFDGFKLGVAGDNERISRMTTFKDQIYRMSVDIDDNIEAAKDTDEYKRLMKNDYTDEPKMIPLANIIPDMKKCNTSLASSENHLSKMANLANSNQIKNDPSATKVINQLTSFLNRVINYYNFRISILSKYFQAAKASLTGTVNNIKAKSNGDNATKSDFNAKGKLKIKLTDQLTADKIKKLYNDAQHTKTYSEYKPIFKELTSLLNIDDHNYTIHNLVVVDGFVEAIIIPEKNNTISLVKGQKLYHTSTNENITHLEPRWATGAGVLFPTPRIYFHTNCPLNRYGNKVGATDGVVKLYFMNYTQKDTVYELKNPPSTVHVDRELGATAVYIETDKPLKVEKFNYEEWKRVKDIDLKLN